MKQAYQSILLVDQVAEAVDSIIDCCDQADLPPVKISTAFNADYAHELIEQNEFSLLIVSVGERLSSDQLQRLAEQHFPKPTLALIAGDSQDGVLTALRCGAQDVFIKERITEERSAFSKALSNMLYQAGLVEKNFHYREALEKSLHELQIDQQAARQIQQNMLPDSHVTIHGIAAEYLLIPSLYLSGDFVDVIEVDQDKTLFYLADVSGHGASSALVTVLLKNMTNRLLRNFRRRSSFDILSPIDTLYRINTELLETGLGKHLSIFIGIIDSEKQQLTYAVGGHHPMPILSDKQGNCFLEGRGMPVGLFPEPMFDERKIELPAAFQLTLFSDGILEMLEKGDLSDKEQRLLDAVSETKGQGPDRVKERLLPGIISETPDDIAILMISRQ